MSWDNKQALTSFGNELFFYQVKETFLC